MTIKVQIGHELKWIPNIHGFRFRGVEENGDLTDCIVIQDTDGFHRVYRESDGEPHFKNLRGWCQHLPDRPAGVFQKQRRWPERP